MKDPDLIHAKNQLPVSNEPLWKNFPTVDTDGRKLLDFMMIFPGFKKLSPEEIQEKASHVYDVLRRYKHVIKHASLNLKTNILMVSVKPIEKVHLEITSEIQELVPEARLVSHM